MSALPPQADIRGCGKPRVDVVGALATNSLLDHHWDQLVLVRITQISHVASFGPADRHQRVGSSTNYSGIARRDTAQLSYR